MDNTLIYKQKVALFDMDGVIVDTEPIYDIFWQDAGQRYQTGIADFAQVIKGTILSDIIKKYFSSHSPETIQRLVSEVEAYEASMPLPLIPGALKFLHTLKANNVRTGLVTSSGQNKVERVIAEHNLEHIFDTIVSEKRITRGKPDPMCYLQAAADLHVPPCDCIAFEDSFNGIKSATAAGMRVIGLSTTNPAESMADMVYETHPDFLNLDMSDYRRWER
jgi:HAD superfamily hydrolase (TIGR01509 family)